MPSPERARGQSPPRRGRGLALALLLLAGGLAGCLSRAEEPLDVDAAFRQNVPTERPRGGDFATESATPDPGAPVAPVVTDPTPDPRLNLSSEWKRGDRWYYESNRTSFLRVVVMGIVLVDGEPHYRLRTDYGKVGYAPSHTMYALVTMGFVTLNTTLPDGTQRYDPGDPGLRFLPRDGSVTFNETLHRVSKTTGAVTFATFTASVHVREAFPLYPVRVPGGTFNASHFKVYAARIKIDPETGKVAADGRLQRTLTERWYSPDVGNDVMILSHSGTEDAEEFQLVYAVHHGKYRGLRIDYEK